MLMASSMESPVFFSIKSSISRIGLEFGGLTEGVKEKIMKMEFDAMLMSADSILRKYPIRCIEYIIKLALILNSLNFDP